MWPFLFLFIPFYLHLEPLASPAPNYFTVHDAFSKKEIKKIALTDNVALEKKVAAAFSTFKDFKQRLSLQGRIKILEKFLELLVQKKNRKKLIAMAIQEGGKPWQDTVKEFDRAIESTKITLATLRSLSGRVITLGATANSTQRRAFTYRVPLGVVLAVSAFNHPINLAIHQILPAVAAGCPVLFKPAKKTPSCAIFIQALLLQAGLPQNYCQLIHCSHQQTEKLLKDQRIRHLSFIGAATVGWHFRSLLAPGTSCTLEHGGTASAIVTKEAALEPAADAIIQGAFYHSGQVCVSVQKVWVQEELLDSFLPLLVAKTKKLKVGNPKDKHTQLGPVISLKSLDRIDSIVHKAVEKGGKLLLGGQKINATSYQPTLLFAPPLSSQVVQEELFGPVLVIYSYKSLAQAVEEANKSPFCFQAAIFSKDIDKISYAVKRLQATTVMINDHTAFREDGMPFGGRELSGMGWSGIPESIKTLYPEKLVIIKNSIFT